jgi:hypothetical protein
MNANSFRVKKLVNIFNYNNFMEGDFVWTDGIELALNYIRNKSFNKSEIHKKNYYFFKGHLKYFRVPTIILSGLNSVFSVGLQPYISQGIISVLCCSISLICGIITSVELFLGIQNMMEEELISSKEFFILSSDIFKTLSVERQYRLINGKIYLDNIHTKYCNLIEQSNLLNKEKIQFNFIKTIANEDANEQINKEMNDKVNQIEEGYYHMNVKMIDQMNDKINQIEDNKDKDVNDEK